MWPWEENWIGLSLLGALIFTSRRVCVCSLNKSVFERRFSRNLAHSLSSFFLFSENTNSICDSLNKTTCQFRSDAHGKQQALPTCLRWPCSYWILIFSLPKHASFYCGHLLLLWCWLEWWRNHVLVVGSSSLIFWSKEEKVWNEIWFGDFHYLGNHMVITWGTTWIWKMQLYVIT